MFCIQIGENIILLFVAFGMEVNISAINLVIHWGKPPSVMANAEEIGHAGRSGERSESILCQCGT